MAKIGKLREVITDTGIYYYRIQEATTYDNLFLYTKKIKKININFFGKKYTFNIKTVYNKIESDRYKGNWWLEQSGDRVENIKKVIDDAISKIKEVSVFDPEWDGVMCKDKAVLRDLLITKILEEKEK